MPERKVAAVEFTESEAMGLIWLARCGEVPIRGYGLESPEGTNMLHASDGLKKLVRALAIEQGTGGYFDQGERRPDERLKEAARELREEDERRRPEERMIDAVRQPPEWAGNP